MKASAVLLSEDDVTHMTADLSPALGSGLISPGPVLDCEVNGSPR
jgi:hypothetical protein